MSRQKPPVEIRTTVVNADYDSFRAALSRSIIGTTVKKFLRKGVPFYQAKAYNVRIVERICRTLYETLQSKLPLVSLKNLWITAYLEVKWDENGRILSVSRSRISVYQKIGDLHVNSANIQPVTQKVRIEFFYSSVDIPSRKLKEELDKLETDLGKDSICRSDYDIQDPKNKKISESRNVQYSPTIVINDTEVLENPSRSSLNSRISEALAPSIIVNDSTFEFELSMPVISKSLVRLSE